MGRHSLTAFATSALRQQKARQTSLMAKISKTYGEKVGKRRSTSWNLTVTNLLIAANVIVYLLTSTNPYLTRRFMKINARIAQGQSYRLLTAIFLHANTYHLFTNSYSLAQIGPQIERMFGPTLMLAIYLGSGVAANLGTFLAGSSPFSLGASASTFGLLGAFALEGLKRTIIMNLLYGFSVPNIDNAAHIGAGATLTYAFGPTVSSRPSNVPGRRVIQVTRRFSWGRLRRFLGLPSSPPRDGGRSLPP
eukprot:scaffold4102_cov174-Ochromonas_danica.AAC.4